MAEQSTNPPAVVKDPSYTTEEYTQEYYDWILKNQGFASHRWRLKYAKQLIDPGPGDRIVDLGCGAGNISLFLAQSGAHVHGVDLAPLAVETCRKLCKDHPNATFEVGDASELPHLATGSFDKAVSSDVTEHVGYETMLAIFREAHRLLKPGGTYFTYTPNPLHWIERAKTWGLMKQDPSHTGLRTRPVIEKARGGCGFEIAQSLRPPTFIKGFNVIEWLWARQIVFRELGGYRVVILARKPAS